MDDIKQLRELLANSHWAVVFTGAGISTESGIPGFRGHNGLWGRFKPTNYQDFIGPDEVMQKSWRQWFEHRSSLPQPFRK